MKVYYNQNEIGRIDKRFSNWELSEGKDSRVRRNKRHYLSRIKKRNSAIFEELIKTAKLIVILALITGFIYTQAGI